MKQVPLDTSYTRCGGHGRLPVRTGAPRTEVCPSCRGKGLIATKEGRAIIGLLGVVGLDELLPKG